MSETTLCANEIDTLERARNWAARLVEFECRGSGDLEGAMHRLAARYGFNWRDFWTLKYRPPKDVSASLFVKLQAAYGAECQRQLRKLEHEIEIARIKGVPVEDIAAEAQSLVARKRPVGG